jgi:hypothetical protein
MFCIGSTGRERPLVPRLACFAAFAADNAQGIAVSGRGRIPASVMQQYQAATTRR